MPEGPEVQTVLNDLASRLQGVVIEKAQILYPKICANMDARVFEKRLEGQRFEAFHRHGKYLVFVMTSLDWICHLRMEGKLFVTDSLPEEEKVRKHIHAVFALSNGKQLCYMDTRKFGRMYLYERTADWQSLPVFQRIGPDVLDPALKAEDLALRAAGRALPVKSFLLDQSVIAGIGNIYADEILFASRIDPRKPAKTLSLAQWKAILANARSILQSAIEQRGTTIRSFSSGNHEPGSFQNFLKVHQRKGQPCPNCGVPIEQIRVGQRSTYYCPVCQKTESETEKES